MTDSRHLVCPHCHKTNRVPADKNNAQISQWLRSKGL